AQAGQVEAEDRGADQAVHQVVTRYVSTAWLTSRASISRPSSLNVPTTSSRVGPLSVSGGGSNVSSSRSTTSPIRSTSRLTGSPSPRRITFITGPCRALRAMPNWTRRSTAAITWPRRLNNPPTAGGASGTGVYSLYESTSCTVWTSTPNSCSATSKVANCRLAISGLHQHLVVLQVGVEVRVGGEDRAPDVEQLGHPLLDHRGADQAVLLGVAAGRRR